MDDLTEQQWRLIDEMAGRNEVVVHEPVDRNLRQGIAVYAAGVNWSLSGTPRISEEAIIWPSGIEETVPR